MIWWGCPHSRWCCNPQGHRAGLRTGLFPVGLFVECGTLGHHREDGLWSLSFPFQWQQLQSLSFSQNDCEKLGCEGDRWHRQGCYASPHGRVPSRVGDAGMGGKGEILGWHLLPSSSIHVVSSQATSVYWERASVSEPHLGPQVEHWPRGSEGLNVLQEERQPPNTWAADGTGVLVCRGSACLPLCRDPHPGPQYRRPVCRGLRSHFPWTPRRQWWQDDSRLTENPSRLGYLFLRASSKIWGRQ